MRFLFWVLTLSLLSSFAYAAEKPNVVMFLADDQGWGDLGVSGNKDLKTPYIDSLARDGASMERFYVCPVCSPTRAEMLTGRYASRLGVTSTSAGGERLNLDELTIAETFKSAGYVTAAFGKWHNGTQWPYHPNARGFDEFYGFCSGHWGDYFDAELEHNGELIRGKGYITDDFTSRAIDFIEKNKARPFFCYLPYCTPHSPMQVPDRFWKKFDGVDLQLQKGNPKERALQHNRAALAMCENIDWNVGRVLKTLDELGIAENTMVIYFSDNGPNGHRWNGGMKGVKGSTDEGGVRSPFFIRWPGVIRAGVKIPQIAGAIDLLPTLAELSGIPVIGKKKIDGVSLKPLLLGEAGDWRDRMIFNHWRGRVSLRTQRYRLDHQGQLFDMLSDPGQQKDVSKEHLQLVTSYKKAIEKWREETKSEVEQRPFTVGHQNAKITHLPARDGKSHGTIKRSSIHPNCSFFTNWTNKDDSITWDIELLTAGTYLAQVYYTCKKENAGVTLELSFEKSKIQSQITEAHDTPLEGEAENRVFGTESYVKDFRPHSLGVMNMPIGRGVLKLRATDIPGSEAVDVRYVTFTRIDEK